MNVLSLCCNVCMCVCGGGGRRRHWWVCFEECVCIAKLWQRAYPKILPQWRKPRNFRQRCAVKYPFCYVTVMSNYTTGGNWPIGQHHHGTSVHGRPYWQGRCSLVSVKQKTSYKSMISCLLWKLHLHIYIDTEDIHITTGKLWPMELWVN